jgi:DNA-binding NtrC family response regulator
MKALAVEQPAESLEEQRRDGVENMTRNSNQQGHATPTGLPQVADIFSSFAGDMESRRSLAARFVSALECKVGARAAVFEDREDESGSTSLLLAGGKPAKSSSPRGSWSLILCGAAGADGASGAWRSTVRVTVSGQHDESCAAALEALVASCHEESARREAEGSVEIAAPSSGVKVQMGMVVGGPASAAVITSIELYARERLPVLVVGENGTGKERIAQALHERSGRTGNIVTLNCGCIPRELIADDLFGHEKGAFTGAPTARKGAFEAADGGTLFLDEIGEMPPEQQVALLRTLQEGTIRRIGAADERPVNVRVVAATNCDLEQMVADGKFRRDLYYRLCVLKIVVRPLRERRDEIAPIVRHHIEKMAAEHGSRLTIAETALRALEQMEWRGNVRELVNMLDRGRIHATDGHITAEALGLVTGTSAAAIDEAGTMYAQAMAIFESRLLTTALLKRKYNLKETSGDLGISMSTLHRRMRELGIKRPQAEREIPETPAATGRVHALYSLRTPDQDASTQAAAA